MSTEEGRQLLPCAGYKGQGTLSVWYYHHSPNFSKKFSLICSRTWCSLVAPLRCDALFHIDRVLLPAAGLPWRSRVLYARWRFSMYLWIPMCMRAHLVHVAIEISDHSPNFLDTPHTFLQHCHSPSVFSTTAVRFKPTNNISVNTANNVFVILPSNNTTHTNFFACMAPSYTRATVW
jgi:hypothetical protein